MSERTIWETIELKSGQIVEKLKEVVEAGNVRRVRIRNKTGTIAEFPLTAGVVGVVIAPVAAAIGVAHQGLHHRYRAHSLGLR